MSAHLKIFGPLRAAAGEAQQAVINKIRELHTPRGRAAQNAFIVEGRKNIEHFLIKGYQPVFLCSSHDVVSEFMRFVYPDGVGMYASQQSSPNPSLSGAYSSKDKLESLEEAKPAPRSPMAGWKVWQKATDVPLTESYWTISPQGMNPPLVQVTLKKLSPKAKKIWQENSSKIVLLKERVISKISQHPTSPQFLAVFPLLPNIACLRDSAGHDYVRDEPSESVDVSDNVTVPADKITFSEFWQRWLRLHPEKRYFQSHQRHPLHDPYSSSEVLMTHSEYLRTSRMDPPPSYEKLIPASCIEMKNQWDWRKGGLVLAGLSDPGNVGTLIRTAAALKISQIVVIDGVDVFSHKVVQSTAGALTDVNIVTCSGQDFIEYMKLCRKANIEKAQGRERVAKIVEENDDNDEIVNVADVYDSDGNKITDDKNALEANDEDFLESLQGEEPYLAALVATNGFDIKKLPPTLEEVMLRIMLTEEKLAELEGDNPCVDPASFEIDEDVQLYFKTTGRRPWLVVGSEAHGIPGQIQELCHVDVTIPMPGNMKDSGAYDNPDAEKGTTDKQVIEHDSGVGSLNASVAGSLACYLLKKLID